MQSANANAVQYATTTHSRRAWRVKTQSRKAAIDSAINTFMVPTGGGRQAPFTTWRMIWSKCAATAGHP